MAALLRGKSPTNNHWQNLAPALRSKNSQPSARYHLAIVKSAKSKGDLLESWKKANNSFVNQNSQMLAELKMTELVDLSMLAVASRNLSTIAGS